MRAVWWVIGVSTVLLAFGNFYYHQETGTEFEGGAIIALVIIVALYFIPAIIAASRNSPNATAILVLNLLLGWTVLGWVAALVWSFVGEKKAEPTAVSLPENIVTRTVEVRAPIQEKGSSKQTASIKPGTYEIDVAGEAHKNADGSSRQRIIAQLHPGEPVSLIREPENKFDTNAIRIDSRLGTIGYVARLDAVQFAPVIDQGFLRAARVKEILGGTADKEYRGVWLEIEVG